MNTWLLQLLFDYKLHYQSLLLQPFPWDGLQGEYSDEGIHHAITHNLLYIMCAVLLAPCDRLCNDLRAAEIWMRSKEQGGQTRCRDEKDTRQWRQADRA